MASDSGPEITAEAILATAKRLGIGLDHKGYWYDPETRCGCAAAVAAILLDPSLAADDLYLAKMKRAGLSPVAIAGLSDGFEGYRCLYSESVPGVVEDTEEYRRYRDVGRAVADAIGAR